jgi:hypothetical protein
MQFQIEDAVLMARAPPTVLGFRNDRHSLNVNCKCVLGSCNLRRIMRRVAAKLKNYRGLPPP